MSATAPICGLCRYAPCRCVRLQSDPATLAGRVRRALTNPSVRSFADGHGSVRLLYDLLTEAASALEERAERGEGSWPCHNCATRWPADTPRCSNCGCDRFGPRAPTDASGELRERIEAKKREAEAEMARLDSRYSDSSAPRYGRESLYEPHESMVEFCDALLLSLRPEPAREGWESESKLDSRAALEDAIRWKDENLIAQQKQITEMRDYLVEWSSAVLAHYPETWAYDPTNPRLMVDNIVRAARTPTSEEP